MIVLKELRWSNCFSYGPDNVLNLAENGLTQLLGINGVGKSSIPLIIEEVLFNKNSKGTKKANIPNRNLDSDYYSMGLDFSVDEHEYIIEVLRKKTLKISLTKNGEDISSHTATNTFKTIEGILGLDFKTFSQLVYQNANSSLQFLTATDTTRKRFLIDLLNLDKYVEYFEVFKALVKDHNNKVVALSSKIETLENWLSKNNLEGMMVLPTLNLEIIPEKDEKDLVDFRVEFENISGINKKISANNLNKTRLAGIDLKSVAGSKGGLVKYDHLNETLGALKAKYSSDQKLQLEYGKMSSKCPTCGQTVDITFAQGELERLAISLAENLDERKALQSTISDIVADNLLIIKKRKLEAEFETLYNSIDHSLVEELLDAKDLEDRINGLGYQILQKKLKIETTIKENQRRDRNNTKIQIIEEQTNEFELQLQDLKLQLEEVLELFNNLEVLKKAFSTNGLLAYKIEYLVKELETLVNEYLAELSEGRFTLEFVILKDKLNVNITDNGKEVDITSLSSGELARVNTATLIAIRQLMNSISKSRINVLFLDEVISVLDEQGRENLVDVLVKETKLNTFIVSHEWSHPLLAKLSIVKDDDDISRVDNG